MLVSQRTKRRLRVRSANLRSRANRVLGTESDFDIAIKLDIHPSTLSNLMTGKTQPSEQVIVKALDTLGGPFEELFNIVDEAA